MPETTTSAAKASDSKKADKAPVDNATLAFMLRESADIVEKGEFDVILYHALQDFRTYYKLHLPKRKEKHKKKPDTEPAQAPGASGTTIPSSARTSAEETSAISETPAAAAAAATTVATTASATSDSQSDAANKPDEATASAENAHTKSSAPSSGDETKPVDPPSQNLSEETTDKVEEEAATRETSAAESTVVSEDTAATTSTTPSGSATDPPTSARFLSDAAGTPDHPIHAESARMHSMESVLDSTRSAEEFSNEASLRGVEEKSKAKQSVKSPLAKKASAASKSAASKLSAGMFATKNKMKLGTKKLGKIHVNLPSSGKKKRESELLDLTGGDVAQYAESSSRRTAADDAEHHHQQQYFQYPADEVPSPQRSNNANNLQPAVTGLANTEPPLSSTTTSATAREIPVDRVRENYSEPAEEEGSEKPSSSRNNNNNAEIHNAASSHNNNNNNTATETETEQIPEPVPPSSSIPSFASTSASSDAFVSDPTPEYFDSEMPEHSHAKPAFQRPKNKKSAVVANGWIEQQRRSKMRTVWKEVLASLVQGKRPGEETTLWIQRDTIDATTGKRELEALHQIPVKLIENVVYAEYTTDDRFSLKLYNSHEEFVFRCNNDPSAAMNWVTILQQYEMETKKAMNGGAPTAPPESVFPDFPEEKKGGEAPTPSPTPARLAIRDLRAICHGAGINTAGMERTDLERAAAEVQQRGTYFAPPTAGHAAAASVPTAGGGAGSNAPSRSASPVPPPAVEPSAPAANGPTSTKMSIKDLRAICHGAGISTVGMERGELERAAAEVQQRGTYFAAPSQAPPAGVPRPPTAAAATTTTATATAENNHDDEAAKQEEMRRRQAAEDEARRRAAEEEHWRRHEEETRRRAAEDEHRRRAEEEHRRRLAEEEHRRRVAEQQAAQAAEQRRRYAEQQAAWQHQQQQEEHRRRMAEQQAAEQRRRHEEAMRKQQQWAGQQPQHHQQQQHQGWSHHPPQQQHPHHQQPQQGWSRQPPQQHHQQWQQQQQQQQWHHQQHYQQQQQQQQQARPQAPPQQHAPPPQQQSKYAKMANQSDDDGQAAITKLKHDILITWALQPPQLQMLRSVDVLLSTIQNVFPPALGVPAHDYFRKWKAVTRESVLSDVGIIDEEKVKKAVRKLRFFLHPDKLPKDLNSEQQFMVKMLWDITNDAWEEYQKSKEDLDWVG